MQEINDILQTTRYNLLTGLCTARTMSHGHARSRMRKVTKPRKVAFAPSRSAGLYGVQPTRRASEVIRSLPRDRFAILTAALISNFRHSANPRYFANPPALHSDARAPPRLTTRRKSREVDAQRKPATHRLRRSTLVIYCPRYHAIMLKVVSKNEFVSDKFSENQQN